MGAAGPNSPSRAEGSEVGSRRRSLVPDRWGWVVMREHEMRDARERLYICPPDELREALPGAGSFLIRTALAPSRQGIVLLVICL